MISFCRHRIRRDVAPERNTICRVKIRRIISFCRHRLTRVVAPGGRGNSGKTFRGVVSFSGQHNTARVAAPGRTGAPGVKTLSGGRTSNRDYPATLLSALSDIERKRRGACVERPASVVHPFLRSASQSLADRWSQSAGLTSSVGSHLLLLLRHLFHLRPSAFRPGLPVRWGGAVRCGKATKASFGHGDHAGAVQLSRMMAYRPRSVQGLQLYCTLVHFKLVPHGKKEEKKKGKKKNERKKKRKKVEGRCSCSARVSCKK